MNEAEARAGFGVKSREDHGEKASGFTKTLLFCQSYCVNPKYEVRQTRRGESLGYCRFEPNLTD